MEKFVVKIICSFISHFSFLIFTTVLSCFFFSYKLKKEFKNVNIINFLFDDMFSTKYRYSIVLVVNYIVDEKIIEYNSFTTMTIFFFFFNSGN